jgi:hypothetical protein
MTNYFLKFSFVIVLALTGCAQSVEVGKKADRPCEPCVNDKESQLAGAAIEPDKQKRPPRLPY